MSTPGNDGLVRPNWAEADELMRLYYDTEWGMPVTDERGVFERLCLEGFQAGPGARFLRKEMPSGNFFPVLSPSR